MTTDLQLKLIFVLSSQGEGGKGEFSTENSPCLTIDSQCPNISSRNSLPKGTQDSDTAPSAWPGLAHLSNLQQIRLESKIYGWIGIFSYLEGKK